MDFFKFCLLNKRRYLNFIQSGIIGFLVKMFSLQVAGEITSKILGFLTFVAVLIFLHYLDYRKESKKNNE